MQHINAAGIAKKLNIYFANNKDPEIRGLFAFVSKKEKENSEILDDWYVQIGVKGSCDDCLGGGCSPPQQPDCPANDPSFPFNIFTAPICFICKLPIFRKLESADKEPHKIDGNVVCEDCFKKAEGDVIENSGGLGYVPPKGIIKK